MLWVSLRGDTQRGFGIAVPQKGKKSLSLVHETCYKSQNKKAGNGC
jgi:hypothetical protein